MLAFAPLLLPSTTAQAVQYNGTPVATFRVDRPAHDYVSGEVVLTKVRVHHCAGGHTDVSSGATVDPTDPVTIGIPSGNHCALTFYWGSDLELEGPAFKLRIEDATTYVPLAVPIDPVVLDAWTLVSGSYSGADPRLLVSID